MPAVKQMKKIIIICGPTATGKTKLGISLAKKINGEIISADSRQVYKKMDIGTGKDLPRGSRLEFDKSGLGYYLIDGIKLYGYDLVESDGEFSVSRYLKFAKQAINQIEKSHKTPIIVGGTGLYIKGVVDGIPTAEIPRNEELRDMLFKKSADELYESLSQTDPLKAASLNSSDKKNPRRLIRAVEIAQYLLDHPVPAKTLLAAKNHEVLFVGLQAPWPYLESKINARVDDRINSGFADEVHKLLLAGVDWNNQSMMSMGYRQWRDFIEGAVDLETVISEWKKEERKYAHRQMIWWKKDTRVNWFDVSNPEYQKKVENMIEMWNNTAYVPEN